ncbi:MAG: metallophosphoesterase [Clostridia bacterium]
MFNHKKNNERIAKPKKKFFESKAKYQKRLDEYNAQINSVSAPKQKRKRTFTQKIFLTVKVFASILIVFAIAFGALTIATGVSVSSTIKVAKTFDTVTYESQLTPIKQDGHWTFTTDNDFKILQLTDLHIGGGFLSKQQDKMAINAISAMITYNKPDLVIITGDMVFPVPYISGSFNNKLCADILTELMRKLGVYYTVSLGNHDAEAYNYYSREQVGNYYQKIADTAGSYCLFDKDSAEIDGQGNQLINIKNSLGLITQSLFIFDSQSYTDGDWLGLDWKYDNIHENQLTWYTNTLASLNQYNTKIVDNLGEQYNEFRQVKSLAFWHIPLQETADAYKEYVENGRQDTANVKFHFGYAGEAIANATADAVVCYPPLYPDQVFETILSLGSTKGIFYGHDHLNNFSLTYKGIMLTYGMSIDYLAYKGIDKFGAQRGCNIIISSPNSSFTVQQSNYYQDIYQPKYPKETVSMDSYYK